MNPVLSEADILLEPGKTPEIPLPKGWTDLTLQANCYVIALARIAILNAGNWPNDRECDGLRLRVENTRLRAEVNMLQSEIAIKDSRFARIDPKKRPHDLPTERLEILAVCAKGGFSSDLLPIAGKWIDHLHEILVKSSRFRVSIRWF